VVMTSPEWVRGRIAPRPDRFNRVWANGIVFAVGGRGNAARGCGQDSDARIWARLDFNLFHADAGFGCVRRASTERCASAASLAFRTHVDTWASSAAHEWGPGVRSNDENRVWPKLPFRQRV